MKKTLFFLLMLSSFILHAQEDPAKIDRSKLEAVGVAPQKGISNIPNCFCCDNAFNLPVPPIKGPDKVKCGDTARFTSPDCPGTKKTWTISPTANTQVIGNAFVVYPPLNPGTYVVTLTLSCGKAEIKNSFKFTVDKPVACNPSFTYTATLLANGYININTVPDASTQLPGTEHWWGLQYNGSFPNCTNPCVAIPFTDFTPSKVWGGYINSAGTLQPYMGTGLTKGTSGYGINYSGFPNHSCVKITHYIKCCGELYRQTQCVSFTTSNNKLIPKTISETAVERIGHVTLLK